jgi:hypothetical protein
MKYSYHFWEAEIFDYAFENSKLLKENDRFFKSTWRYIVHNINDLIEDYKKQEYFFYKWFWLNSTLCVNTAFFMTTRKFYENNLYKKQIEYYKNNYKEWSKFIPLEWVFYNLLKKRLFKDDIKIKNFPIFHFFKKIDIYREDIKNLFWLLWYWKTWLLIEKIFKVIRK